MNDLATPSTAEPTRNGPRPERPRVVAHNVASVDGRLAISPGVLLMFDERWPTYPGSTYADIQSRHHPEVILEGSGSLVIEGQVPEPLPAASDAAEVLLADYLPAGALARAAKGWLAVVDSRGRVRWLYKEYPDEEWAGWHVLVLVSTNTPLPYLAYLRREEIPYLVVGDERVDLPRAMSALAERLGVRTVVSSAGGRLNGALLRAGLLDEIEVEVIPIVVGGTTTPALFTTSDLAADDAPTPLRLLGVNELGEGRTLLRYAVRHQGPEPPTP